MLNARFASLIGATILLVSATTAVLSQVPSNEMSGLPPTIEQVLSRIAKGTTWQDLSPGLRADLETLAAAVLARDRMSWGVTGLQEKADLLGSSPTPAMTENIDRVLSITYASELPGKFQLARDVVNVDLKRMILRIYLAITDDRGFMLTNHPDFKSWDGLPVRELWLLDHKHVAAMAEWLRETEVGMRRIPDDALTPMEKALRAKSYFTTRAGRHFDRPAVGTNGSLGYAVLYKLQPQPFESDQALLEAYNASMFSEFRDLNVGTLDAFMFDYESEFNQEWLKSQGMSDALADNILKLGNLFRTRIQALPERNSRCTIYSPAERNARWDTFTAGQITNADGSESLQSYSRLYQDIASRRLGTMRAIGRLTLERLFPDGSPELTAEQRLRVANLLNSETRPAMMMDTLVSALEEATGSTAASMKVKDAIARQPMVGGSYSAGDPVREADKAQILDMWSKLRAFMRREYSGYRVDINALIPLEPIIVSSGQNQFASRGQVNLSLGTAWNLASFSSTMMHEMKHAIDQNSHAAVEGAAWEGAATSVERQVWPIFIEEAMAGQAALIPVARLRTEIDNVRFTATTDATLKILLRESCGIDTPDTISYAEGIVQSYGYTDRDILRLRSRRAHRDTQYLQYDYGLTMYSDLLSYLQEGIGPTPRVDAFLLQACGSTSPRKDKVTIDDLKACIRDRRPQ